MKSPENGAPAVIGMSTGTAQCSGSKVQFAVLLQLFKASRMVRSLADTIQVGTAGGRGFGCTYGAAVLWPLITVFVKPPACTVGGVAVEGMTALPFPAANAVAWLGAFNELGAGREPTGLEGSGIMRMLRAKLDALGRPLEIMIV